MSHLKVVFDDKWGMILLTIRRLKRLIKIVHKNEATNENSSVFSGILNR